MVDIEQRQFVEAGLDQQRQALGADFVAGFGENFAGRRIVKIGGDILAVEVLVLHAQELQPAFGKLARGAHGEFLAGFEHNLAGLGVEHVDDGLHASEALRVEGLTPAVIVPRHGHGLVEGRQYLFAVHAERIEHRGRGNLAATVDARIDDVLGVELDVEPGAAIGDDARGEQELARGMALALVVIEEHARRAMHLRDDDALGAVDDERAVHRHQRHVAHIDVLLLDVLDGLARRCRDRHRTR